MSFEQMKTISLVLYGGAALMFLLSVFMFFMFRIPQAISFLTGSQERKEVASLRKKGVASAESPHDSSPGKKRKRKSDTKAASRDADAVEHRQAATEKIKTEELPDSIRAKAAPSPAVPPAAHIAPSPATLPVTHIAPSPAAPPVPHIAPSSAAPPAAHIAPSPATLPVTHIAPSPAAPPVPHIAPSPAIPPAAHTAPSPAAPPMAHSVPPSIPLSPTPQAAQPTISPQMAEGETQPLSPMPSTEKEPSVYEIELQPEFELYFYASSIPVE